MAGFAMPIDPSDPAYERMRLMMSPEVIADLIRSMLSAVWRSLPSNEQRMPYLDSRARLLLDDVSSAWRAMSPQDRAERMQKEAAVMVPDLETCGSPLSTADEAADIEAQYRAFFSPAAARLPMYHALVMAPFVFPPDRRDDASIEAYVRKVFERELTSWWADARDLSLGLDM